MCIFCFLFVRLGFLVGGGVGKFVKTIMDTKIK